MASTDTTTTTTTTEEQGPSSPGSNTAGSGSYTSFQWLLAWTLLIVVLILAARTRIGYLLIYYALALSVLILLVTQYKWFAGVLAPFGSLRPGLVAPGEKEAGGHPPESASQTTV